MAREHDRLHAVALHWHPYVQFEKWVAAERGFRGEVWQAKDHRRVFFVCDVRACGFVLLFIFVWSAGPRVLSLKYKQGSDDKP